MLRIEPFSLKYIIIEFKFNLNIYKMIETESYFEYSPGKKIFYKKEGNGTKVLLLIHGFGTSTENWKEVVPFLINDYLIYRVDLKGFGKSDKPVEDKYTAQDQADILISFLKNEKITELYIAGHSFGGAVAALTYFNALKINDINIKGLIFISPTLHYRKLPLLARTVKIPVLSYLIMNIIPNRLKAWISLKFIFYNKKKIYREKIDKLAEYMAMPGAFHSFIITGRSMTPFIYDKVFLKLNRIEIPVLLIWGKNDPVVLIKYLELVQKELKNCTTFALDRCGHIPHTEYPEQVSVAIKNFVEQN